MAHWTTVPCTVLLVFQYDVDQHYHIFKSNSNLEEVIYLSKSLFCTAKLQTLPHICNNEYFVDLLMKTDIKSGRKSLLPFKPLLTR